MGVVMNEKLFLTEEERKILGRYGNLGDAETIEEYAYVESLKTQIPIGRRLDPSERIVFRLGYMAGFEQKFK
jgi:hypothetical protein